MTISPLVKNIGAITYTFIMYGLGVGFIIVQPWQLNVLGVVLLVQVVSQKLTGGKVDRLP